MYKTFNIQYYNKNIVNNILNFNKYLTNTKRQITQ